MLFFLSFLSPFPSFSAICEDIFMCVLDITSAAKSDKHLKYAAAFFQTHNYSSLYQRPQHLALLGANSTQTYHAMQLTPWTCLPPPNFPLRQINDQERWDTPRIQKTTYSASQKWIHWHWNLQLKVKCI